MRFRDEKIGIRDKHPGSATLGLTQSYHHELYPLVLRVKNWRIPEAELLNRLRSLHQSSSSGEQEQEHVLTNKGGKPALFTRIGFKSTTMEQIQAILDMKSCLRTSVADPGCLSRILDPDFYPSRIPDLVSRIPDPKTATKERGEKKIVVIPCFVATNFTKLKIILCLNC